MAASSLPAGALRTVAGASSGTGLCAAAVAGDLAAVSPLLVLPLALLFRSSATAAYTSCQWRVVNHPTWPERLAERSGVHAMHATIKRVQQPCPTQPPFACVRSASSLSFIHPHRTRPPPLNCRHASCRGLLSGRGSSPARLHNRARYQRLREITPLMSPVLFCLTYRHACHACHRSQRIAHPSTSSHNTVLTTPTNRCLPGYLPSTAGVKSQTAGWKAQSSPSSLDPPQLTSASAFAFLALFSSASRVS